MIMSELDKIFQSPTHLHLLCWNINDLEQHKSGLLLLNELLNDEEINKFLLIMIRPIGRPDINTYDGAEKEYGVLGVEGVDFIKYDAYHSHCEIWIQCANEIEAKIWRKLVDWINKNNHGFARKSLNDEIWRPFESDLSHADNYYPRYRDEINYKSFPLTMACLVTEYKIPWLIKYMWARATEPIIRSVINNNQVNLIDPSVNSGFYDTLKNNILAEFDLCELSLSQAPLLVNPSNYGVSHMSAFAINVATSTRPNYQVEYYFGKLYTHPYVSNNG